jgi:hypothetical protein
LCSDEYFDGTLKKEKNKVSPALKNILNMNFLDINLCHTGYQYVGHIEVFHQESIPFYVILHRVQRAHGPILCAYYPVINEINMLCIFQMTTT